MDYNKLNQTVTLQLLVCYLYCGILSELITPFINDLFLLNKKQRPLEAIHFYLEAAAGHLAFYVRTMPTLTLCWCVRNRNWIISPSYRISYRCYIDGTVLIEPEQEEVEIL